MGLVSPIGSDLDTVWQSLSSRKSGISKIENLDCRPFPFESGGEVRDFTGTIDDYGELDKKLQRAIKKNMKVMCREIEMGVAASQKALQHCGLEEHDPERCGCLFGCDYILTRPEEYADGLRNCREKAGGEFHTGDWPTHGLNKVNPLWLLKYLPNMPNSHVSIYNDFRGPNNSITDRDASMNLAISEAASIIERGAADLMIVGATGSRLHPLRTSHVVLLEAIAKERRNPNEMARPFDRDSDGMVLGEGAGAVILESREHAERRGAKIWAEILGRGSAMVGQPTSPPANNASGNSFDQERAKALQSASEIAIRRTLTDAGELPAKWHVHAQGLGVPESDWGEASAIAEVLKGQNAPEDSVSVTAAKSYFGNLGAGSAAVETICSLLALEHGELFPILNLDSPIDPATWASQERASNESASRSAGNAFLHSSITLQGQASCVLYGKAS